MCGVLRSSPISDEVPLFSLVTANLADIGKWGLWLVALTAWSESDDPTTISLRTCRPWVACGSSSSAIVTQRGSLAGSLAVYSTLFRFFPKRASTISWGVLSQGPSPVLAKEPPAGGCLQRPKQESSVSSHHSIPASLIPAFKAPKRRDWSTGLQPPTLSNCLLSSLFLLFISLSWKRKLLLTLSSPIKEHHPMAQLSFCGRILRTASLAGFLFITKWKKRKTLKHFYVQV